MERCSSRSRCFSPPRSEPLRFPGRIRRGPTARDPDLIDGYTPGACGSSYTEDIYTYDPEAGTFTLALSGRGPTYDDEKGEIVFTECGSCACERYTRTVYRLKGSAFLKVSEQTETREQGRSARVGRRNLKSPQEQ